MFHCLPNSYLINFHCFHYYYQATLRFTEKSLSEWKDSPPLHQIPISFSVFLNIKDLGSTSTFLKKMHLYDNTLKFVSWSLLNCYMIFLSPIQIYFFKMHMDTFKLNRCYFRCHWLLWRAEGLLGFNYSSKWKGAGLNFEAS